MDKSYTAFGFNNNWNMMRLYTEFLDITVKGDDPTAFWNDAVAHYGFNDISQQLGYIMYSLSWQTMDFFLEGMTANFTVQELVN